MNESTAAKNCETRSSAASGTQTKFLWRDREMGTTKQLALFTPVQLGGIRLKHRVVMSPLTRSRSTQPDSIPNDLMREYYGQRASDGGLVITEATNISLTSRGWAGAPGIYTKEQIQGWKRILAAVHAKGGVMISQLWHTGRSSHITMTGGQPPVSASVNPCYWQDPNHLISTPSGWVTPSPHRGTYRCRDRWNRRRLSYGSTECEAGWIRWHRAARSQRLSRRSVSSGQQ